MSADTAFGRCVDSLERSEKSVKGLIRLLIDLADGDAKKAYAIGTAYAWLMDWQGIEDGADCLYTVLQALRAGCKDEVDLNDGWLNREEFNPLVKKHLFMA